MEILPGKRGRFAKARRGNDMVWDGFVGFLNVVLLVGKVARRQDPSNVTHASGPKTEAAPTLADAVGNLTNVPTTACRI